MVFWFFRKKDNHEHIKKHIDNIHNNIQGSFKHIKKDMGSVGEWIDILNSKDIEHTNNILRINKRLHEIEERITKTLQLLEEEEPETNEEVYEYYEEEEEPETTSQALVKSFKNLTKTQQELFKKLWRVQKERGGSWILLKDLASELYPTKSYSAVRSTISDYLSILEEVNLIQRKRLGRQTLVSITDKGKQLVKKAEKEIKKTITNQRKPSKKRKKTR